MMLLLVRRCMLLLVVVVFLSGSLLNLYRVSQSHQRHQRRQRRRDDFFYMDLVSPPPILVKSPPNLMMPSSLPDSIRQLVSNQICMPMPVLDLDESASASSSRQRRSVVPPMSHPVLISNSIINNNTSFAFLRRSVNETAQEMLKMSSAECLGSTVRPKVASRGGGTAAAGRWAGLLTPFAEGADCPTTPPSLDTFVKRFLRGDARLNARDCEPANGNPKCRNERGFARVDGLMPSCERACGSAAAGGCGMPLMLFDWPISPACQISWNSQDVVRHLEFLPTTTVITLFVASRGTGAKLHVDGRNTSFWSGVLAGTKEWVVFEPNVIQRLVAANSNNLTTKTHVDEPDVLFSRNFDVPSGIRCWVAEQKAGDVVHVPNNFAHQVKNGVDGAIALSSNY